MYKYKKILYIFCFLFLIFIDQLSKYLIRLYYSGFYICNHNLAFGLNLKWGILIFIFLFILIALNFQFKIFNLKLISNFKFQISNWSVLNISGIILIASGGISNIIDRLHFGCVIDFIDLKFWPVFNLADIYITLGVILILISYFKSKEKNNF